MSCTKINKNKFPKNNNFQNKKHKKCTNNMKNISKN